MGGCVQSVQFRYLWLHYPGNPEDEYLGHDLRPADESTYLPVCCALGKAGDYFERIRAPQRLRAEPPDTDILCAHIPYVMEVERARRRSFLGPMYRMAVECGNEYGEEMFGMGFINGEAACVACNRW